MTDGRPATCPGDSPEPIIRSPTMATATRTADRKAATNGKAPARLPLNPPPPDPLAGIVGADLNGSMHRGVHDLMDSNLHEWEALVKANDWYDLTSRLAQALTISAGMLALQDR